MTAWVVILRLPACARRISNTSVDTVICGGDGWIRNTTVRDTEPRVETDDHSVLDRSKYDGGGTTTGEER